MIGYGSGMVDGPLPDTGMDTKSEEGDPGGRDDAPLSDDERAMLERLRTGLADPADTRDTTLPAAPPPTAAPDPLDPVFREPSP